MLHTRIKLTILYGRSSKHFLALVLIMSQTSLVYDFIRVLQGRLILLMNEPPAGVAGRYGRLLKLVLGGGIEIFNKLVGITVI